MTKAMARAPATHTNALLPRIVPLAPSSGVFYPEYEMDAFKKFE
jgi:hypothetical protein